MVWVKIMKKKSFLVPLKEHFKKIPYVKLFSDIYNREYFDSYSVVSGFVEDPVKKLRDNSNNQVVIFYQENVVSLDQLINRSTKIKIEILKNLKSLVDSSTVTETLVK